MNEELQTPNHDKIWTTIGSAGTVDETDSGKVFFDHSVVQMGSPILLPIPLDQERAIDDPPTADQPTGIQLLTESAVIRYNVTPVDGLIFVQLPPCRPASDCLAICLELRYLASGNNGQVVAKLIEVDMVTGEETVRLTFNSADFDAADRYEVQLVKDEGPSWIFDFRGKAYYIEATLTRSSLLASSAAGIQMIKIRLGLFDEFGNELPLG